MWWRDAIVYEVYIRSFADGSGDGMGDLLGLTQQLDYLKWLGVTAIWVTPFYPSPGYDGGYDVADYVDVDPVFGKLDAFETMVAHAHRLGLRVIVDLVPNHSSSQHPWFINARSSRTASKRDFYIWRDGEPDTPPNNWLSVFGGPAWTYDEATGQWWLHQFLPEQPDLNWAEPRVHDAFDDILQFWMNLEVDGFRIDVAHGLVKHPELPDLPPAPTGDDAIREVGTASGYHSLLHIHDVDQDGVLDVYRRWRRRANAGDAVLLGEVFLTDVDRLNRYIKDDDGLHASFWFPLQQVGWDVVAVRRCIEDGMAAGAIEGSDRIGTAWALDSHDQSRSVSRYGGGDRGRARSLAMTALVMGLPGVPVLYQGQELGLENGIVPDEQMQDPIALRSGEFSRARDRARTPMPWVPDPGMGFCPPDVTPWLPFGGRTPRDAMAVQQDQAGSPLSLVRELVRMRAAEDDLRMGAFSWYGGGSEVIAYRRGTFLFAANFGAGTVVVPLNGHASIAWHHSPAELVDGGVRIKRDSAVIVRLST